MVDQRAKIVVYDIECYPNYFFIGTCEYERSDRDSEYKIVDNSHNIWRIGDEGMFKKYLVDTKNHLWIGFNNKAYDDLMIVRYLKGNAMTGNSDRELRSLSDLIITDRKLFEVPERIAPSDLFYLSGGKLRMSQKVRDREWQPKICDLMLLSGKGSLKMKAIILGADSIMESPYSFTEDIPDEGKSAVEEYCLKDLDQTFLLYEHLESQLKVRDFFYGMMGNVAYSVNSPKLADIYFQNNTKEYKMSKKSYFNKRIKLTDCCANKDIEFHNEHLAKWWRLFKRTYIAIPPEKSETKAFLTEDGVNSIEIPDKENHLITFGLGGLHSTNKNSVWECEDDEVMYEIDCTSMYPTSVVNYDINPGHVPEYSSTVSTLVDNRNKYKVLAKEHPDNKDYPVMSDAYKLINNSIFGKMKDKYAYVFDAKAMFMVTITNQVLLVKLIDMLIEDGIDYQLVQANTDAIVIKHKKELDSKVAITIKRWEEFSVHSLGRTDYDSFYQESVNNYVAIYKGGKGYKAKGSYVIDPRIDQKMPQSRIVKLAAIKYMTEGVEPIDTIRACQSVNDFIMSVNSTDFESEGEQLGYKAIRVIYSNSGSPIQALKNDKVRGGFKKSIVLEGEKLKFIIRLSEFTIDELDVNYSRYEYEAWSMIYKIYRPKYDNDNVYFVPKLSDIINTESIKLAIKVFCLGDQGYISLWYDYLTSIGLSVIPKNFCKNNYVGVRTKDKESWKRVDPHNAMGLGIVCDNVCSIDIDNPDNLDPVLKEILQSHPTMKIWHGEDRVLSGGKGAFLYYVDGSEKLKSSSKMVDNLGFEFLNDEGKVQTIMGVHPKAELYQCSGDVVKIPNELVDYLMNCKTSDGKRAIPRISDHRSRYNKAGYIPNPEYKQFTFNMDFIIPKLKLNDIEIRTWKATDDERAYQFWDLENHWFVLKIDPLTGKYYSSTNHGNFGLTLSSIFK